MLYRRANAAGGTYFFTVNLADHRSHLLVEQVAVLRQSVRLVKSRRPFEIVAWVVLPDHLHTLWTLPQDDADFSTRWALIKSGFSRQMDAGEPLCNSRQTKGERGIWQRRFWEHQIRDDDDLARHIDYVHINPVKHDYVARASDWPHSTIHRYVRQGMMSADWASGAVDDMPVGER